MKVLDFGLAKPAAGESALHATQAATVAAPISNAGEVMGTVPYMAPEQLRGEPVDARGPVRARDHYGAVHEPEPVVGRSGASASARSSRVRS